MTIFHSRWQEVLEQDPYKDVQTMKNYLGYVMKNDRCGLTTYKLLDQTNKNEAAIQDTAEFRNIIHSIGLDYDKAIKNNFYAVFENGVKIAEEASDTEVLKYKKDLSKTDKLTISTEGKGSIKINNEEHSIKNFGFNLVLYNNKTGEFIESTNIDFKDGLLVIGR